MFFGSNIDGASSATGERYADSENAFAYRKAMRADCTCNGRDPAGLAPVDLTLDASLRPGDVIATTDGLVAYSGVQAGDGQTAEFTPVASYPGLTAGRARAARRDEGRAGARRDDRRRRRVTGGEPRCRAARDDAAEEPLRTGEAGGSGLAAIICNACGRRQQRSHSSRRG